MGYLLPGQFLPSDVTGDPLVSSGHSHVRWFPGRGIQKWLHWPLLTVHAVVTAGKGISVTACHDRPAWTFPFNLFSLRHDSINPHPCIITRLYRNVGHIAHESTEYLSVKRHLSVEQRYIHKFGGWVSE